MRALLLLAAGAAAISLASASAPLGGPIRKSLKRARSAEDDSKIASSSLSSIDPKLDQEADLDVAPAAESPTDNEPPIKKAPCNDVDAIHIFPMPEKQWYKEEHRPAPTIDYLEKLGIEADHFDSPASSKKPAAYNDEDSPHSPAKSPSDEEPDAPEFALADVDASTA